MALKNVQNTKKQKKVTQSTWLEGGTSEIFQKPGTWKSEQFLEQATIDLFLKITTKKMELEMVSWEIGPEYD